MWSLRVGLRYTEQRGNVGPFAVAEYSRALDAGWRLIFAASGYERSGDYEIHRLPELTLRWSPPTSSGFLTPSLDLSVGSIQVFRPQAQTERAGVGLTLTTHPMRLGASTEVTPSLRVGGYSYGTGASHSFWVGSASLVHRPTSRMDLGLTYVRQDGTGTSPLAYDYVGLDNYVSGRVGMTLTPSDSASLTTTFGLTPYAGVREYIVTWTRSAQWTGSLTWRQSDGRLLLGLTLAE
jgi:hypothetical protein